MKLECHVIYLITVSWFIALLIHVSELYCVIYLVEIPSETFMKLQVSVSNFIQFLAPSDPVISLNNFYLISEVK